MPKQGINEEVLIGNLDSPSDADYEEVYDEIGGELETIASETEEYVDRAVYKVLHQEDKLRRNDAARKRRERMRLKKETAGQNVFLNLKAAQRREKIKQICSIKADSDNLSRLFTHARKLQNFIRVAVKTSKVKWESMSKEEKISFLRQFYAGNPEWLSFLAQTVKICFPAIDIYRTKCNPAEFNKIILEEVLVPLANLRASQHMVAWYSNKADAVEEKMRERMIEILKNRLK